MSTIQAAGLDRSAVENIVRDVLSRKFGTNGAAPRGAEPNLVVNISARHMHITQESLEVLFGAGAKLTVFRELYQDGQFASEQTVTIIGPRHRTITNLRILGPCRSANQIELAFTDGIAMGLDLPVRMSGELAGSPGCIVMGPKGHIEMTEGVVRALRHVHMGPADAAQYGISNGDVMKLHIDSDCGATLEGIVARVHEGHKLEVHLDTDEGNACNLANARGVKLSK